MPVKLEIQDHAWNEERERYVLDGEVLLETNHDEHGWAGMDTIRKALIAFANKTGVEVTFGEFGEDDD